MRESELNDSLNRFPRLYSRLANVTSGELFDM
jgi:hypothetical protein